MADSKLYPSLFALVDSHLSNTSLQQNGATSIKIPLLNGLRNGCKAESFLKFPAQHRLPIPVLSTNESPIQNVLAEQITNMLRAKEKRQLEIEKQKLADEMRKLEIEEEKSCVIDLMKAIQTPYKPEILQSNEVLSSSSSLESLFDLNFSDCEGEAERLKTPDLLLPCTTDITYILKEKINKAKPSAFGKVLVSRVRPVVAPYFRERIPTNIVRFDFNSPSPCDIIKTHLLKPKISSTFTMDTKI